jgi:DNA replication initiation complex subunit (GINS family)
MMEEEINYGNIRKLQLLEKNSPVLTELPLSFYKELSEYLDVLNKRLGNEQSLQKQTLLKDEISNTERIAINIYEQRERKILLAAVSKVRGGNPDLKNMLDVEENLYNSILNVMMKSRNNFLKNKKTEKKDDKVENKESKNEEKKQEEMLSQEEPNQIVRVTQTLPEFIGTNTKKYNLREGDILSLPEDMCLMLSKKGAVKKLEV